VREPTSSVIPFVWFTDFGCGKSVTPLAFVIRLRKDTRRTLMVQYEVRRADERGLRYKAYASTTPRRCSSLDLELWNNLTLHG
jgi:hypothetical protein